MKRPDREERRNPKFMPKSPFDFGCYGYKIFTGGAKGVDCLAEEMAEGHKMAVELKVPEGHRNDKQNNASVLSQEEEECAHPKVIKAAKHLKKNPPKQGSYAEELILRNYTLIENAKAVYVFGNFLRSVHADKGEKMLPKEMVEVAGGTGWVVKMVIDYN